MCHGAPDSGGLQGWRQGRLARGAAPPSKPTSGVLRAEWFGSERRGVGAQHGIPGSPHSQGWETRISTFFQWHCPSPGGLRQAYSLPAETTKISRTRSQHPNQFGVKLMEQPELNGTENNQFCGSSSVRFSRFRPASFGRCGLRGEWFTHLRLVCPSVVDWLHSHVQWSTTYIYYLHVQCSMVNYVTYSQGSSWLVADIPFLATTSRLHPPVLLVNRCKALLRLSFLVIFPWWSNIASGKTSLHGKTKVSCRFSIKGLQEI